MAEEYSVYQFFLDDSCERVISYVSDRRAQQVATQLIESVGGRIGTTRRVIITDGGDNTAFEWKYGEGVTFPPAS